LGLTVGLTLQYSKFTIGLGYEQGLTNFDNFDKIDKIIGGYDYSDDAKFLRLKNRNIKFSVGYFF